MFYLILAYLAAAALVFAVGSIEDLFVADIEVAWLRKALVIFLTPACALFYLIGHMLDTIVGAATGPADTFEAFLEEIKEAWDGK